MPKFFPLCARYPDGVSGAELAEQLRISRAAVWARIEELRKVGFDIEAGPHFGYRLVDEPDALLADDLLARLGKTRIIGRDIQVFEETTSTNDVIEKLARDGVKEGVVVFAESQTRAADGSDANGFRRRAKDCGFQSCCGRICVRRKPRN